MTAHTKVSSKGDLAVPKDVLERQGWPPGTELELVETESGILVRPKASAGKAGTTYEEFRRRVPKHEGPPVSIEDMDAAILKEAARRWREKEARSR